MNLDALPLVLIIRTSCLNTVLLNSTFIFRGELIILYIVYKSSAALPNYKVQCI